MTPPDGGEVGVAVGVIFGGTVTVGSGVMDGIVDGGKLASGLGCKTFCCARPIRESMDDTPQAVSPIKMKTFSTMFLQVFPTNLTKAIRVPKARA